MVLSNFEATEIVRRASANIILPPALRPISYLIYFVVWSGRKISDVTRIIKELLSGAKHPGLHGVGLLISISGITEQQRWIAVSARIICIVRPLIDLSDAGYEVKESVKGVSKSIFRDTKIARLYQRTRGTASHLATTRFFFFFNDVLPLFAKRLSTTFMKTALTAMYSCDLYEALTAENSSLVIRSLSELQEIVDKIGEDRLYHAIDFHASWINPLLHKYHNRMDAKTLKRFIHISAQVKSIGGQAVSGAIDISMRGIFKWGDG